MASRLDDNSLQIPANQGKQGSAQALQPAKAGPTRPAAGANLRRALRQAAAEGRLAGPEQAFLERLRVATRQAQGGQLQGANLLRRATASLPTRLVASLLSGTASRQEDSLLRRLPASQQAHVVAYRAGSLSFAGLLSLLPYPAAKALLDARQKAIDAFFKSWGESIRENAERDRKAALRSQAHSRAEAQVDAARHQLQVQLNRSLQQRQQIRARYEATYLAALGGSDAPSLAASATPARSGGGPGPAAAGCGACAACPQPRSTGRIAAQQRQRAPWHPRSPPRRLGAAARFRRATNQPRSCPETFPYCLPGRPLKAIVLQL